MGTKRFSEWVLLLLFGFNLHAGFGAQVYQVPDDQMIPQYARASIRSRSGGFNVAVSLRVMTDQLGRVTYAHAFEGPRTAYGAAEQAERKLQFTPFLQNGKPVRASFIDEVWLLPLERWLSPRVPFPSIRDPRTLTLRMERRSWCFEPRCLYYDVEVRSDGRVKLVQGGFVFQNPKVYTGALSSQALTALIDEFRKADFFSLRDAYVSTVTDCQGAILSILFDGRQKSVGEYCGVSEGAPNALSNLEKRFDDLVNSAPWLHPSKRPS